MSDCGVLRATVAIGLISPICKGCGPRGASARPWDGFEMTDIAGRVGVSVVMRELARQRRLSRVS